MHIDAAKIAREVLLKRLDDLEFQDFRDHADNNGLGELDYGQLESAWAELQKFRRMIAATGGLQTRPTAYKTIIKDRFPIAKLHSDLGHARAAVGREAGWNNDYLEPTVRGGRIYAMHKDSIGWQLVHDIPSGTRRSELPWKKK